MQQSGLRADQVVQVRGYADQQLRKASAPLDPSNRRISLIVEYPAKDSDKDSKTDSAKGSDEEPAKDPDKDSHK
jgi:chemotaxis protein MotB